MNQSVRRMCSSRGLVAGCWIITTWLFTAAVGSSAAAERHNVQPGRCMVVAQPAPLDRVQEVDEFRIRYTLSGGDALSNSADANSNGVPDVIEDLATQLTTARELYSETLGLRHPLHQPRYRLASAIDVLVRRMSSNGVAYDEVNRPPLRQSDCVLTIALSSNLRFDRNLSPAHELFHLYQYGYAMFKRGWYLEGMARWMESAFIAPIPRAAFETPRLGCEEQENRSYDAAEYWRGLARQGTTVRYSASLRSRTYTDGRPVIATPSLPGGSAVRPLLEALENASAISAAREGVRIYSIPEAIQRSPRSDATICSAIEGVARSLRGTRVPSGGDD